MRENKNIITDAIEERLSILRSDVARLSTEADELSIVLELIPRNKCRIKRLKKLSEILSTYEYYLS